MYSDHQILGPNISGRKGITWLLSKKGELQAIQRETEVYWDFGRNVTELERVHLGQRTSPREIHCGGKRGKYDDQIHSPLKHPERKKRISRNIWVVLDAEESV